MALSEQNEFQTTVLADGQLEVRKATIIMRDGEEISKTYHRHVVDVGDDVESEDQSVKDIAGVIHTPARKAARETFLAKQAIADPGPNKG